MTQPLPLPLVDRLLDVATIVDDDATDAELRARHERAVHDAKVARNIAAELQRAYQAELARRAAPKPERKPGEGEVPAERFGPRDRTR